MIKVHESSLYEKATHELFQALGWLASYDKDAQEGVGYIIRLLRQRNVALRILCATRSKTQKRLLKSHYVNLTADLFIALSWMAGNGMKVVNNTYLEKIGIVVSQIHRRDELCRTTLMEKDVVAETRKLISKLKEQLQCQ